ncbi:MAG TPA: glycosyltransferase 87 family protein [Candidatus Eisenbacteria bacterium]|nr:glycosyltransferase 87 family protein [Candidatus Eisenbacteria bacterium]
MTHSERALLLVGVASAALTAAAGFADGSRADHLLVPWLIAHALYLLAVWLVVSRGARLRLGLLVAVGLLPRLLLLPAEPRLSEDLYRYLWDGRLVADGVNPFTHAPNDPALERYHGPLLHHLNHADVPTIYPPMAQLLFGATARLAVEPWAWKATLLALEAMLLLALAALLRARGQPSERLLLYFWNPLVVVESFGNGHVDLAAAAFLLLALAFVEVKRSRLAGGALAAAVLVKYMPLLLLPALLRRRAFATLAAAAVAGALLFLPFVAAGGALWTGLTTYLRHWEFNGSIYAAIRPFFATGEPPRLLLAAAVGAASLVVGWKARTLTGAALALLAAWIAASPTVYPWYLVMLVALLPLHADLGLLLFSGLVALSYAALGAYRTTGAWALPAAIPWIEYGGWALAAAWTARAAWRRRYRRAEA